MERFKQYIPFKVTKFTCDEFPYGEHTHNHFEIILIRDGKGKHIINKVPFEYKKDDIFLIAPDDSHYFEVEEATTFCYFKFTELLFKKDGNEREREKWMKKIESILFNPNLTPGDIKYTHQDKTRILCVAELIIEEYEQNINYSYEIITDAVSMILSIIARNINNLYDDNQIAGNNHRNVINDILGYIRENIYDNEKIKIESIASHFNISKNYLSVFFKKYMGESIRQHINNHKLALAENRIRLSDFTCAEIAFQLGYTDESHFNKAFKKKYGSTPKRYRDTSVAIR